MSATFSNDDKDWKKSSFRHGRFTDTEFTLLESTFDEQTDFDVNVIEKKMEQEKILRNVCLYKVIIFPVELALVYILLGKKKAKRHKELTSLYLNYLRKKITLKRLQEGLVSNNL